MAKWSVREENEWDWCVIYTRANILVRGCVEGKSEVKVFYVGAWIWYRGNCRGATTDLRPIIMHV